MTTTSKKISPEVVARAEKMRGKILSDINKFKALGYVQENIAPSRFRKRWWTTPGVRERDLPRFDREQLIAKAREFVEKHPLIAGMVSSMTDSIVSSGMTLSMCSGDEVWDAEVEAWWTDAKDLLDVRRIRSHGQLQRAWWTRRFVDGDVGIYKWSNPASRSECAVHTIEAERIRQKKYDYLDQGVVYDDDGRMVKAFISPRPKDQMDWKAMLAEGDWVKAKDFILYMNNPTDRIDVLRGTSGLLTNFNTLQDLVEIIEAILQKIKNEAFIGLMLYTESGGDGKLFGDAETDPKKTEDGKKRRIKSMVPGMILDLAPSERAAVLQGGTPHAELIPFMKFLIRQAGCVYGWPLELTMLDMSETNFSGGRLLIELAKRRVSVEQDGLGRVNSDVFRWRLGQAVAGKELVAPKDSKISTKWMKHVWTGARLPYYDPGREAQAAGAYLDRYLTTPQAILADRGEMDAEAVLNGWQEWEKMCAKRGLTTLRGTQVAPINVEKEQNVKKAKEQEQ